MKINMDQAQKIYNKFRTVEFEIMTYGCTDDKSAQLSSLCEQMKAVDLQAPQSVWYMGLLDYQVRRLLATSSVFSFLEGSLNFGLLSN